MGIRTHALVATFVLAVLSSALGILTAPTTPAIAWAPVSRATIHPGVRMYTAGGQCTANFVFTDGYNVFLGYAAHCAGLGGAFDTNGCRTGSLPLGTPVEIEGASRRGVLAYSSWVTMRSVRERDPNRCAHNDFALVRLNRADIRRVNPSVPHWGGPTGVTSSGLAVGSTIRAYGRSALRLGLPIGPIIGVSEGTYDGWEHPVYSITPGVPGDSGMAGLDEQGRAFGVFTKIGIAPYAGESTFIDLYRALRYMRAKTSLDAVRLVTGTAPFRPGRPPVET